MMLWLPTMFEFNDEICCFLQGTGKKYMEKQIAELEKKYPDKVRGVAKFNVPLAHMIIAGADFMLIPSRFEPCGLIQLHAMRYGTVIPLNICFFLWSYYLKNFCPTCIREIWQHITDNFAPGMHCFLHWWTCWHCQGRLHRIPYGTLQCWGKTTVAITLFDLFVSCILDSKTRYFYFSVWCSWSSRCGCNC